MLSGLAVLRAQASQDDLIDPRSAPVLSEQSRPETRVLAPRRGSRRLVAAIDDVIYTGFTEVSGTDIANFENAVARKIALPQYLGLTRGQEDLSIPLDLNVEEATGLWNAGYVTMTGAYEAKPFDGFTVDRLLSGEFDAQLHALAERFKAFGHPIFFSTAREPNGVLVQSLGGFGADGSLDAASATDKVGLFDPSKLPTAHLADKNLFQGLGDPAACDGLERLAAAQRYYYDFFVQREGIDFLTFDSMGLNVRPAPKGEEPCEDYEALLRLIAGYVDWASLNWYFIQESEASEPPLTTRGARLTTWMDTVRSILPGKPVLLTELGFCKTPAGPGATTVDAKIEYGMGEILSNYPEIHGFMHWGESAPPFDCGITSSNGGATFKRVLDENDARFSSCVNFSDGTTVPNCDPKNLSQPIP
ncbi:MAG: hypothetical protein ABI968_15350 [Acidobacteriota bacterium]